MGKVHGSLARAGKVKNQTPKVAKQEKKKQPRGRAFKRLKYTQRYLAKTLKPGEKLHMNKQPPGFSRVSRKQMGKVHGSLARAGKVKNQTPKVAKQEKKKQPRGRAFKRLKYTQRYLAKTLKPGEKLHMNKQPPGKAG